MPAILNVSLRGGTDCISPLMKSPNNLSITMPLNGHDVVWYPGKEDALNLKGTRRTLDGGSGDNYRPDMEDGIISRALAG